ncbi:uncharacterized protein LOC121262113 [Juglans microcarpa x Juglans regia]|uniref:uncharacterized protein LOC121262113 n=1 Tax=Juglans microcarpa x Juglans regia TaxID=2249226 RepID=UPI001B7E36C3|nr:uncharacterized protein LOC121262113 [Juglans microcarpa x Juglans regia]
MNISILATSEPLQAIEKIQKWALRIGYHKFASNMEVGGKIWLCWKEEIDKDLVAVTNKSFTRLFSLNGEAIMASFIYAKCSMIEHCELWDHLSSMTWTGIPCVVMGDFNIIHVDSERRGGNPRPCLAMSEFNDCIDNCGLIEWNLAVKCGGAEARLLNRSTSEHSPIFLRLTPYIQRHRNSTVESMRISEDINLSSPEQVHEGAMQHFEEFLGQSGNGEIPDLSSLIQPCFEDSD